MACHNVSAQVLLAPGFLNDFSIGAFLGFQWTAQQKEEANKHATRFFEQVGLIPTIDDIVICEYAFPQPANGQPSYCGLAMKHKRSPNRKLGFMWRCRGDSNNHHQERCLSPTDGTILFNTKLEMRHVLKMLYLWASNRRVVDASMQSEVHSETAVQWYLWFRETIATVAWHDFRKIGGPGDIVEIDETLLYERKANVGRTLEQFWVFGGVSRSTGHRFAMRVLYRDGSTLLPEIMQNIEPGTRICDMNRIYKYVI